MSRAQRKKILQILNGRKQLTSRSRLSREMGLEWDDIEYEMGFLIGKKYVSVETITIGTQKIEGFSLTDEGIDLIEGRGDPSILADPISSPSNISILFLAAEPTDRARLRLGKELREIQGKLQLARERDRFTLQERFAVRPADITQALLDIEPQIVHFSGHGTTTGALCFEDEAGEAHSIPSERLAILFENFTDHVNCVILNACYSEAQANAIVTHINYVIGMSQAISDKAAIAFSVGFYQALGAGRSVEDAYKLGCAQIGLVETTLSEHLTPVLIKKI